MFLTARVLLAAGSPQIAPLVRECLRLRALARALLFGAPPSQVEVKLNKAQRCSPWGWTVFLRTERCAIALHTALQEGRHVERLDGPCAAVLLEIRQRELKRALAARGQLVELATIAAQLETPAIVLKGGLAAIGATRLLDLMDVDVLLPGGSAERFARELDRRGYSPAEETEAADDDHLSPRRRAGALQVEVHRRIRGFPPDLMVDCLGRSAPIEAAPGLFRLAPADHLWHLLLHCGIQHPERSSALRDQLLIRHAVADCDAAELAAVRGAVRAHPRAAALQATLDAALADGRDEGDDSMMMLAAARYAAGAVILRPLAAPPAWVQGPLQSLTLTLALDRMGYRKYWSDIAIPAPIVARRLGGRAGGEAGGHLLLLLLRVLRLMALTPAAACLAWKGVRAARAHQAEH